MDSDKPPTRNSSVRGSLTSQNSSQSLKKPRRNVGDKILITSSSKVYVNQTETNHPGSEINKRTCDSVNFEMVSDSIRKSKDLPKIRNTIFEESLESQEVSFYIDDDTDACYENLKTQYESDTSDSFEDDVEPDIIDQAHMKYTLDENTLPDLPEPPRTETNGLEKFAKNVRRFKKNFSRDITKSLRRMSKRVSQIEPDIEEDTPRNLPLSLTNLKSDDSKPEISPEYEPSQEASGLLTKIRRSLSLSTVSVSNLITNFENQRKSTFYVTEPIDIDTNETANEAADAYQNETDRRSISSRHSMFKTKLTRPKSPPPPAPIQSSEGKFTPKEDRRKSLYTEAGLFKNKNFQTNNNRTSWYAEIGLYPKPSPNNSTPSLKNKPVFTNVIDELNYKLNKNNDESNMMENDTIYNQSVRSFSSSESKKDDSSVTYAKNDITFLEDEPLYQFYDAEILKSYNDDDMSDFEYDLYEEVQDIPERDIPISRSSVVQVGLSNQTRSLWCEIPEVVKSSVLSQLSAQQKKLQEAKFEIITSEASYLNSLNVLSNHFNVNFKHSNIINEKEMDVLFGKLEDVICCSKKILYDLEKCWQKNILLDGICDVIQKHAEDNFHVYIPYCENQVLLGDTLNQMKERPAFMEFLAQLESSTSCQFLTLYSFLMLPMQRITRWPLLVDAILKRLSESDPEFLTCQYALATISKIVSQCNEAARKKEREIELRKISETMEFSDEVPLVEINVPNRWLIRSGVVICFQSKNDDGRMTLRRRFNKIPLNLFLFNDLFVVTRKKSENLFLVLHYCSRNLVELRSTELFPMVLRRDLQNKHLLYLSILENQERKIVEFLLSTETETDKERWIEAFSPPKSENPDETLYECWDCPQVSAVHSYNACQPDELSLSRGDVINVLRKMSDGWYHGERIKDGQTGWFPANYTCEIVNRHVRARNLKQRYRLLTFSENYLKS